MSKKINIGHWLNNLVDENGVKTEVTLTMTDETLKQLIIALLGSGIAIVVLHHLLKNTFPNAQLRAIYNQINQLKK